MYLIVHKDLIGLTETSQNYFVYRRNFNCMSALERLKGTLYYILKEGDGDFCTCDFASLVMYCSTHVGGLWQIHCTGLLHPFLELFGYSKELNSVLQFTRYYRKIQHTIKTGTAEKGVHSADQWAPTSTCYTSTALYFNREWLKFRAHLLYQKLCRSTALYINLLLMYISCYNYFVLKFNKLVDLQSTIKNFCSSVQ